MSGPKSPATAGFVTKLVASTMSVINRRLEVSNRFMEFLSLCFCFERLLPSTCRLLIRKQQIESGGHLGRLESLRVAQGRADKAVPI